MSNELAVSQESGAASQPAMDGFAGGIGQGGFASPLADPARKAEIEKIMKSDFARYESEGLDREYLEILRAEQVAIDPDSGTPTRPMLAEDFRMELCSSVGGQKLVASWDVMGGFKTHLANVQRDAGEIVRAAGSPLKQRVLMATFDRDVPEAARLEFFDEVASGPPTFVQPASKGEVDLFAKTPAGKDLVAEWSSFAPEKVAILRARAARLTDRLTDEEAIALWDWLDNVPAPVAKAVFLKMAGG